MTSSEWAETKAAILAFKDENIAGGMTDFEKEMKIIQWLSENCVYEQSEDWTMATAYSCIISGQSHVRWLCGRFPADCKALPG